LNKHDFNSLDNQKIPCVVEQTSGYQFLYSLKKDPVSKFLEKYTIINCKGKPVGLKTLVISKLVTF
jgi:hypothetical protein